MTNHQMWHELRCGTVAGAGGEYHAACSETAPGGFTRDNALMRAKHEGWRKVSGWWYCPACVAAIKRGDNGEG